MVVGTIRLAHFQGLFEELNLGAGGALNLFRADGVLVARYPYSEDVLGHSLAGTPTMRNLQAARSSTITGRAALDKVERLYAFRHVGDYPLMSERGPVGRFHFCAAGTAAPGFQAALPWC